MTKAHTLTLAATLVAALAAGCGSPADEDDRLAQLESLVPTSGVVRVDDRPLAGLVVTLIPDGWAVATGEADEDGRFTLTTAGRPGALPGTYKVILSYLIAKDGRVLGLEPRGGLSPNPDVVSATEKLPATLSDMKAATLTAVVPPGGGTIELDVHPDLDLAPPAPAPPAAEETPAN